MNEHVRLNLTLTLTPEQSQFVQAKVDSGEFANADEVISASLEVFQEHDGRLERWLREEVVPVYDRLKASPDEGIPAEDVFGGLKARREARLAGK